MLAIGGMVSGQGGVRRREYWLARGGIRWPSQDYQWRKRPPRTGSSAKDQSWGIDND